MLLVMSSSLDKNKSISRREAGTTGGTTQGQCLHLHSKTFPQRIPKQGAAATKNQAGERIMPEGREIKQRDKKRVLEGGKKWSGFGRTGLGSSGATARSGAVVPELFINFQTNLKYLCCY